MESIEKMKEIDDWNDGKKACKIRKMNTSDDDDNNDRQETSLSHDNNDDDIEKSSMAPQQQQQQHKQHKQITRPNFPNRKKEYCTSQICQQEEKVVVIHGHGLVY